MSINVLLIKRLVLIVYLLPVLSFAQSMRTITPMADYKPTVIVDYGDEVNMKSYIPYRGIDNLYNPAGKTTGAVFDVTYVNFTPQQQTAFQFAVDIWADLLHSDITINLLATMSPLDPGVLGQTITPARFGNFANAQKINTFYSVSMAEKISRQDLNAPGDPDIIMEFSSNFSWYFGIDGNPPNNTFDFVSVILHEIGHGLGFSDGTFVNSAGSGFYTIFNAPTVYDRHLETLDSLNIVDNFTTNTSELGDILTSGGVLFRSFSFSTAERPLLYAPNTWDPGSSIAHLDEATYNGTPNALMTPRFNFGESIHDPGLTFDMFQDLGWISVDIKFDKLLDSEDSVLDKTIVLTAVGDNPIITDSVNLYYSYNNFATVTPVNMTPTVNANEYTAVIPATGSEEMVRYYIDVESEGGQKFTSPGEAPKFFWQFVMAADTIAPEIVHPPLSVVFLHDPVVPLQVTAVDNLGLSDLMLSYKINGGAITTVPVPLISSTSDGVFSGEYLLNWDFAALGVVQGDSVEYMLQVDDLAGTPNSTTSPVNGFYKIQIEEINPAEYNYSNNFNSPSSDFTGAGFTIGPDSGFDSDALHSEHPYRVVDGISSQDTLVLFQMLKTPIILSSLDASLKFDEVVLIEPGSSGSEFGDDQFWDYVIVEGSKDLGVTWQPFADGYDSRQDTDWLERWNSDVAAGNSNAVGDKALFVSKEIDMIANSNFVAGDTVLIRYKLYADQLAHGWGWSIDNIKVQIDEEPPVISQITKDYMLIGETEIILQSKVTDNTELDSVIYEVDYNGQTTIKSFPGTASLLTYTIGLPGITANDVFKYRIIAVDKATNPNTTISPNVGFYEVPVANLNAPAAMYINDFNSPSDDFIGANFNIDTPINFSDPALVTRAPYPNAPFGESEISYLLKTPIILNQNSAWVQYDEGVLTEPNVDKVSFEVSKDGGATWIQVFEPYDSSEETIWSNVFSNKDNDGNSTGVAIPEMMVHRFFNMLQNPELSGGDEVLVRFRVSVNDMVNGWGWIIDNLEIQGPTTGIEDELNANIQIYPNPTSSGSIIVSATLVGSSSIIVMTDILGKIVSETNSPIIGGSIEEKLDVTNLKKGIYLLSVSDNSGIYTSRVIIE